MNPNCRLSYYFIWDYVVKRADGQHSKKACFSVLLCNSHGRQFQTVRGPISKIVGYKFSCTFLMRLQEAFPVCPLSKFADLILINGCLCVLNIENEKISLLLLHFVFM